MKRLTFLTIFFLISTLTLECQVISGQSPVREVSIAPARKSPDSRILDKYSFFAESDVDFGIPRVEKKFPKRAALIIGNENYAAYSKNDSDNVPFARRDALVFRRYAIDLLGIDSTNVLCEVDQTYMQMLDLIERFIRFFGTDFDELVFYYAGHGLPLTGSNSPSLLPVDDTRRGIPLQDIYKQFAGLNATRITVFMDACFSGKGRGGQLLAGTRRVGIKPKPAELYGNMVVFSATGEDQVANPYKEQNHGLFTYFLLKKMKESSGKVSYNDLILFLRQEVRYKSIDSNFQLPEVICSPNIKEEEWKSWSFH